jgi:hypothetical protein
MQQVARWYTVEFHNHTLTQAAQEFFYLAPAANKPITIGWANITSVGLQADTGDAKEDEWRIELIYLPATVTASAGGAAFTPTSLNLGSTASNDTAAAFTARVNDTTVATTSGTAINLHSDGMTNRIGFTYMPPPELRYVIGNAAAVVLRLANAPSAATNVVNGTIYVGELI